MQIKERNFIKDNFSLRTHDNANNSGTVKPPYFRCDSFTFERSIFVSTPYYLTTKMTKWIVKDRATSHDGILVKKFKLQ